MRIASAILLAFPALTACATATDASGQPVAALIVKPRAAADAEALMRAIRRSLPQPAMASYVRPLSGGAHLVHLMPPAAREQVPALVERLRASGDFDYVDLDAPVRIQ